MVYCLGLKLERINLRHSIWANGQAGVELGILPGMFDDGMDCARVIQFIPAINTTHLDLPINRCFGI